MFNTEEQRFFFLLMNTVSGLHSLKRPSLLDFLFCR